MFYDDQRQSKVDEQENIDNPKTPAISNENIEEQIIEPTNQEQSNIKKYLGLSKEQAKQLAAEEWVDFRVVKEDW